jgi:GNAT superfamily N-acetyltransferase
MTEPAQVHLLRDFDVSIIGACRALDALVYPPQYLTEETAELAQIQANPRSRVVATYAGQVVGYIEYIPLTTAGFELFLATREQVFDLLIAPALVSPWRTDTPVDIYIASMVVHPSMQSKGISMVLLQGLMQALKSLTMEGYLLGRLGGTAVSVPGRRFQETMLGVSASHEVPGGIAGLGDANHVLRYLSEYLDW